MSHTDFNSMQTLIGLLYVIYLTLDLGNKFIAQLESKNDHSRTTMISRQ